MTNGLVKDYRDIREVYNEAFHRWSAAVRSGDASARTETEYRQWRNALAELMLAPERVRWRRHTIERVAYSLWEKAGRPQGTAEADWYHAEAMVDGMMAPGHNGHGAHGSAEADSVHLVAESLAGGLMEAAFLQPRGATRAS